MRELVIDLREPRFKGREEEAELIMSSDELLLRTLNEEQRCVVENVSCTYTPSLISLSLSLSFRLSLQEIILWFLVCLVLGRRPLSLALSRFWLLGDTVYCSPLSLTLLLIMSS